MADVFLAVARGPGAFNKLVVVKSLRAAVAEDPRYVLMFMDEAKLSARLNHPNVVQTYEVGGERDSYFIVMEYLEGQPLRDIVKVVAGLDQRVTGFTRGVWVRIIADVLRGLHYAHELADFDGRTLGIVHRDVSPHNIFITYEGVVKVVDFGVAKATLNATRTESGTFKGKVSYAAPEQVSASKACDRRADIFAAGIVLWELLAGRRLFNAEPVRVMHQLLTRDVPRLRSVVPDIAPALDEIVAKALTRDPAGRFATAQEMGEALENYLEASGEDVQPTKLGARMREMFADSRERIRRQVGEQLDLLAAAEPSDEFARPSLVIGGRRSGVPARPSSSLPLLGATGDRESGVHDTVVEPQVDSMAATVARAVASPRSYATRALGVGLAVAVLGGVAYVGAARMKAAPVTAADKSGVKARIEITSEPADATVSWRGQVLGRTPINLELPEGMQVLVVSKSECFDETLVVPLSTTDVAARFVRLRQKELPVAPSPKAAVTAADARTHSSLP